MSWFGNLHMEKWEGLVIYTKTEERVQQSIHGQKKGLDTLCTGRIKGGNLGQSLHKQKKSKPHVLHYLLGLGSGLYNTFSGS